MGGAALSRAKTHLRRGLSREIDQDALPRRRLSLLSRGWDRFKVEKKRGGKIRAGKTMLLDAWFGGGSAATGLAKRRPSDRTYLKEKGNAPPTNAPLKQRLTPPSVWEGMSRQEELV